MEPVTWALPCSGGPQIADIQDLPTYAQWTTLSAKEQQRWKLAEGFRRQTRSNPTGTMHDYNRALFANYDIYYRKQWEQAIKEVKLSMEQEEASAKQRWRARERTIEKEQKDRKETRKLKESFYLAQINMRLNSLPPDPTLLSRLAEMGEFFRSFLPSYG